MVNGGKCTVRPMDPMGKGILTQLTKYPNNYMSIFATKQSTKMQQKFLNSWLHFPKKNQRLDTLKQGSLYYQPKQCTKIREIPQNYHKFALFDSPKMGNLMTPVKNDGVALVFCYQGIVRLLDDFQEFSGSPFGCFRVCKSQKKVDGVLD